MIDPVLGVRLPVQRGALDIDGLVGGIEPDIPHPRRLPGGRVGDVHALEVRRHDQVHVLARVGEEAHHGEVVITRQPVGHGREEARDVEVVALGRQARAARVVVLEDGQERGLVADVGDVGVVEEVEAADEGGRPAVEGYQMGLVMGDEAGVGLVTVPFSLRVIRRRGGSRGELTSHIPKYYSRTFPLHCSLTNTPLP